MAFQKVEVEYSLLTIDEKIDQLFFNVTILCHSHIFNHARGIKTQLLSVQAILKCRVF